MSIKARQAFWDVALGNNSKLANLAKLAIQEAEDEAQAKQAQDEDITMLYARYCAVKSENEILKAKQEQGDHAAWRETHSKVIKALAGIVTVHTPDKLFDLDAIPREPVM